MNIADLFDPELLAAMEREGFVRRQRHPDLPLSILNYTEQAQFSRTWNDVTETCRGLVIDDSGEVVARPFRKFFNHTEVCLPKITWTTPPVVADKLDGSLGIIFEYAGQVHVCTRGSFASDQALWATAWIREQHRWFKPPQGITVLAEIIYPSNRIVVDYGGRADLTLLGAIEIDSGADIPIWETAAFWPGETVTVHHGLGHLDDVYQFATGDAKYGEEGVVATWYRPGAPSIRCKIKHPWYVQAHALVSKASTRTVWRALRDGRNPLDITVELPDEFHSWLKATVAELQAKHDQIVYDAHFTFGRLAHLRHDRKAFAEAAKKTRHPGLVFAVLDQKDISGKVWSMIEPDYERPFADEDALQS